MILEAPCCQNMEPEAPWYYQMNESGLSKLVGVEDSHLLRPEVPTTSAVLRWGELGGCVDVVWCGCRGTKGAVPVCSCVWWCVFLMKPSSSFIIYHLSFILLIIHPHSSSFILIHPHFIIIILHHPPRWTKTVIPNAHNHENLRVFPQRHPLW